METTKVTSEVFDGKDLVFYEASQAPFEICGLPFLEETKNFRRLPNRVTDATGSLGVRVHARHLSGAAVRFCTDSPHLAVSAKVYGAEAVHRMYGYGGNALDLYEGTGRERVFAGSRYVVFPTQDACVEPLDALFFENRSRKMREFTLYLPIYSGIEELRIGAAPGSAFARPTAFSVEKPVLFYGSSITQGGNVSRPGNTYVSQLARMLDFEAINLGFSGNAKGEEPIAEAIASLSLSAFVLDYDHNAPTAEHLKKTHGRFFEIVRQAQPDLPIVMLSKPDFDVAMWRAANIERRAIIRETYDKAVARGDKKVYFIDGETLFGTENRDACTVDLCHPNDLGAYRMAQTVLPVLRQALGLRQEE